MLDIVQIIKKNREEAYELIKSVGGRIDFVENIIKGSTDDSEDDWHGDLNKVNVPFVILSFNDELADTAVLSVKCGENEGDIVFLGYDVDEWTCSGWSSYAECCSNTDNDIYLFVDEWLKDHNEK